MLTPRLAVVGLGLIGGSFAKAVRKAGVVGTIAGFDADALQMQRALADGVIDVAANSAAEAVQGADVVLLAVPVLATETALRELQPGLSANTILTDVGSTKQSVLAAVVEVFGRLPPRFIAGHPLRWLGQGAAPPGARAAQRDRGA